jgi:hypothetical protein
MKLKNNPVYCTGSTGNQTTYSTASLYEINLPLAFKDIKMLSPHWPKSMP